MAPTPSPILVHSPNHSSARLLHHLRRHSLNLSHHPPRRPSLPRAERLKARTLAAAPQPSVALEGPPPPPIAPAPSESVLLSPEPSAISVANGQPQGHSQPLDMSGNIVAAIVVLVLVLGGLIGLVIGGEMLRRRARTERKKVSPPPSRRFGHRKSATGPPKQRTKRDREKFPYDEKTVTPLTRPPPVLTRERQRQRRFPDVWPIRGLSRALCSRRSCPEQVERSLQHPPPMANPHTTWSEFSPVSLYVPLPRTVLACIPEEREDFQSQTNSDLAAMLGVTFQRSPESGSVVPTAQTNEPKSSHNIFVDAFDPESSVAAERCGPQDFNFQITYKADEDAKSLGSSAPDMTSDGGESSRSSMVSLESLEGGNDRESLREEVFELRRAQTRSMQMNKGVLLSLSLKTLDDQNSESTHGECGPLQPSSSPDAEGGKDYMVERELSLAILGGNLSAVNLDEFPSPPSILPMIPSFVSGF